MRSLPTDADLRGYLQNPRTSGRLRRLSLLASALLVIAGVAVPSLASRAAASTTAPDAGQYMPLTPSRVIATAVAGSHIVDSEIGQSFGGQIVAGGQIVNYDFLGAGGVPTSGVSAVVLHVATLNGNPGTPANGYFYVYPATSGLATPTSTNDPHPASATLANNGHGAVADNNVIVPLGDDGQVSFYDGGTSTNVDLQVDVEGYVTDNTDSAAGATYAALAPTRVRDTRTGQNIGGSDTPKLSASAPQSFHILGVGGVPTTGVAAVALNVGDAKPAGTGNTSISVSTSSSNPAPTGSQSVQDVGGANAEQLAIVAPDASGNIHVTTDASSTDFWLDVEGYYLTAAVGGTGNVYVPLGAQTVVNNESGLGIAVGTGGTDQIPAGGYYGSGNGGGIQVTGVDGVPSTGVSAVALSFTTTHATNVTGGDVGYVTAWSDGALSTKPAVTTVPVDVVSPENDLSFIQPASSGKIAIYNSNNDSIDLHVNIEGYFAVPTAPGAVQGPNSAQSGGTAYVSWDAPMSDGGSAVTSYTVTTSPATTVTSVADGYMDVTLTGLNPATTYSFQVRAENSSGSGPYTTASPVTAEDPDGADVGSTPDSDQSNGASIQYSGGSVDPMSQPDALSSGASTVGADVPPTVSFAPGGMAAPQALGAGQYAGYSREILDAEALDADGNIAAINASDPTTTALTGAVTDQSTGAAVVGATVTLTKSDGSGPVGTVVTDAVGAYAFADVPADASGTNYTFTVSATGYGTLTSSNNQFIGGETYDVDNQLTSSPQTDNETPGSIVTASDSVPVSRKYPSGKRIPPTVNVGLLANRIYSTCHSVNSTVSAVITVPWKHYVLGVAAGEITENDFVQHPKKAEEAFKANAAAISNFAWYKEHVMPRSANTDVYNAANYDQCYKPNHPIPTEWNDWVDDVLNNRVAKSSGGLLETQYGDPSSTVSCNNAPPYDPHNGVYLSQLGSLCVAETLNKGWKGIIDYYYDGSTHPVHVAKGTALAPPLVSDTNLGGGSYKLSFPDITLDFNTLVRAEAGWHYEIQRYQSCSGVTQWCSIYDQGFSAHQNKVPTTYTVTSCGRYRVRARNPVGWTPWVSFAGGIDICS